MIGRQTVLFVEDNEPLRGLVEFWLEDAGYRVLLAEDGAEGLEMARRKRPNVVVTDAMMPNLTGDELVEEMKADPGLRNIPIVMATAAMSSYRVDRMLELGCSSVIGKPLTEQQVLDAVEVALREGREPSGADSPSDAERIEQLEEEVRQLRAREAGNPRRRSSPLRAQS